MNPFEFRFNYYDTQFVFNFKFNTDRELLTEWVEHETQYYLKLTCTGGGGMVGGHTRSVRGSVLSTYCVPSNNNDHVYGMYFMQYPTPANTFTYYMGNDPTSEQVIGNSGDPSYDCHVSNTAQYPITYPDNEWHVDADGISYDGTFNISGIYTNLALMVDALLNVMFRSWTGESGAIQLDLEVDTNIPIWDTFQHMHDYIDHGSTVGLLNGHMAPPEEDSARYYIDNLVSNNGNISDIREDNYFHFDGADKCLGFASDDGIHATLYSYNGGASAVRRSYDRGITYEPVNSYPTSYFIRADLSVPAYVITFNTNIPFFVGDDTDSGKDKLDSYMNGTPAPSGREYSILDAWNRSDVDGTIKGVIGELVENTVNGTSSIVYGDGVQMFALTATQKGAFLRDILSGDTMDALIDATKQFGGGAISALQSLRYMPIDASEVCTLSAATTCQIGSYTHTFSSAVDRIQRNDKMINCGQSFFQSPYNDGDFRNLEPWCKLYLALPYAGIHQIAISKYINKRVQIKLAVDITTGACEYHIYANNVEMDSFIGSMGTQIPLTAEDNARQVSGLQNGIIQTVSGLAQIGLSAGATVASGGTLTPVAIAGGVSGVNTMAQGLQNMQKEFIDAPIQTKGASVGNLGDFGINSIYFIFAWANSITPKNELNLVGKPSNHGGAVNSFAGFLKCSAFNLADGFAGTQTEAEEISAIMANGVYC